MKQGYLSQYFEGVAIKRLSAVEADKVRSHQHEFNGVEELRAIMGEPEGRTRFSARFLYLSGQEEDPVTEDGFVTWYDSRQKARLKRGVMRWEYRLYFSSASVLDHAGEGDLLVVAKRPDGMVLVVVAERDSTVEQQIRWLFSLQDATLPGFSIRSRMETDRDRIGLAARVILEQIGVEPEEEAPDFLDHMLRKFGGAFPKTAEFSAFARGTLRDVSGRDDPDGALVAWMEREEILFRTLEKHLMTEELHRLIHAGTGDPEPFIRLVQSTLQRRKSRAGSALENHLEQILKDHGITYARTAVTEGRLKPDFIFPGIAHYHDPAFPAARLTMLASKSTCKDRWRQILNEAARIPLKHLLTLEPGISENQTGEMQAERVQLVLPRAIHQTYTASQQGWLMDVGDFVSLVHERQVA